MDLNVSLEKISTLPPLTAAAVFRQSFRKLPKRRYISIAHAFPEGQGKLNCCNSKIMFSQKKEQMTMKMEIGRLMTNLETYMIIFRQIIFSSNHIIVARENYLCQSHLYILN